MSAMTPEAIESYIETHYLTLEELARRSAVSAARVLELIAAHCVPPHSHEVRLQRSYHSEGFGTATVQPESRRYYHPSLVDWIERAETLAEKLDLCAVAERVRRDFAAEVLRCLDGQPSPWARGIDHAWAYVMDGTFGLCLKRLTVPYLVQKETARAAIARLMEQRSPEGPSVGERRDLLEAIARYDAVTLPFAPHELATSSRSLEIAPAMEAFGLTWDDLATKRRSAA